MTIFCFRCSNREPSATDIRSLRQFVSLGIDEIRKRAAAQESLFQIAAFAGDWQSNRLRLAEIYERIAEGTLPLESSALEHNSTVPLTLVAFHDLLRHLRAIELEGQMQIQIEEGYIADRSEFEPYDDDWI